MKRSLKLKVELFCAFALLTANLALSQSKGQLYKRGIISFYEENFKAAEFFFNKLDESGKSYKDADYRLQISKLVQNKYRNESLAPILKYDNKANKDKFYYYWMGRIYANKYMFAEATEAWNKFLDTKDKKSDEIISETDKFIDHSQKLIRYFDNPDNYEVHQLSAPINTEYAELSPVFMLDRDELIFTSNRDPKAKKQFQVYEAVNSETGWKEPQLLEDMGIFPRDQASVQVVNNDGKLFTYKRRGSGDLYYSERKTDGWSAPEEFDSKIHSADIGSHFYINEHEDRIIFASSDRKNGLELMESFKNAETGEWESPHPFALNLNTRYDEDSPFLSSDEKTFYFSSDRPNGVGGFDVYRSTFDESTRQWSEPENLGWPVNSPDDDINFKMNPDQKSGYLASNRLHSKGDFDIYFFWQIQKTSIEGRIVNAATNEPVSTGEIRFLPSQYLDEYFRAQIGADGRYKVDVIANETFKVEIHVGRDTLLMQSFEVPEAEGERITHHKDFFINTTEQNSISTNDIRATDDQIVALKQGETFGKPVQQQVSNSSIERPFKNADVALTGNNSNNAETVKNTPTNYTRDRSILRNIYFQFGTSQLRQESEPRLQELLNYMKQNPGKKVEISGHTDKIGSRETNLMVSQARAEAVKRWLVSKGIATDRIITNGYGESQPLASNDDEIDGRELNRRIEISVIQ